ncbi:MAG TPA: CBS domain-containing protein [Pyrinomonadaceae bacterium]|jgi:CBS domain-containing protein|nr:CBS domain-containing protein [Pyrinomonadaceae bacterium]
MQCPSCGHENIEGSDRCDECLTSLSKFDVPRPDSAEGLARSVMEDNLSRLDPEPSVSVGPDSPALDVAQQMKSARSGCALVLEDGKLVGIFTEHDVLHRMFAVGASGGTFPVKELMSHNPEALQEGDSVATALNKMSMGRYRHIPVARKDGTYTVTSIKSVLKYIAKEDW